MRNSFVRFTVFTFALALISSCGSTTPSGSGSFTATIDGTSWAAASSLITVTPSSVVPGTVIITGTQLTGTNTTSVSLLLGYMAKTGVAYPLGVNQATTAGGTGLVETTSSSTVGNWTTGFSGAAGTVTLTTLTSTQIAGNFTFTAPPQVGVTGANKSVTNGKFNLAMTGFVAATSADPGSILQAALGGTSFNGATVVGQGSGGAFSLLGSSMTVANGVSTNLSVSLTTSETVVAGNSYPFTGPQGFSIQVVIGSGNWGGGISGDSGSVTVTSLSGGRAKGSFNGTLGGNGGTGGASLAISGTFDVKIQ